MSIIKTPIHIGISSPIRLVHMTDTHLCLADMRDGERKVKLGIKRTRVFEDPKKALTLAGEVSQALGTPILHTGDLIDFVSTANLEFAKQYTDENDVFIAAGNHEFSLYVGEAWEDADYRNRSLAKVQACFQNDIRMSSRVIGGINFVALDDGYYLFEEEQLDFLKAEVARGLPIVLMMHNPLYEKEFFEQISYRREEIGLKPAATPPCAYLTGVPAEMIGHYDDHRRRQQTPDEVTLRTVEYIRSCPLIRGILAGHVHYSHVARLREDAPQIITAVTDIRIMEVD